MNIFQRIYGHILYAFGKIISFVLTILLKITEVFTNILSSLGRSVFLGGGLILIVMFLAILGPFALFLIFNPYVFPIILTLIILFVIVPILGKKLISYLEYLEYSVTEYLYGKAEYFKTGVNAKYKSYSDYKNHYKRMKEEMRRQEYERQKQEESRVWEERFKQYREYQSRYGSYQNQTGGHSSYGNSSYSNPMNDFKGQYESACDTLEVAYDADEYAIKLQYRKMAKKYHPDLNKAEDAKAKFQKVNEAYEFLNTSNIERYKSMTN